MRTVEFINVIDGYKDHYTLVEKEFIFKLLTDFSNNLPTERGYYLCINPDNTYVAVDNMHGHVFIEEYDTLEECIQYFSGVDLEDIGV